MKALIVDDEKHVREAVRYFVPWEEYGIEAVYEAANGKEAVELIKAESPAIIFTDMRMPLMDGAELLEWIHEHSPRSKVIVISGYQDYSYVQPAIVYGGMDYLLKPLNSKQLVLAAERAVQKWKSEEQERFRALHQNIQLNMLQPLYWDKVFSELVSGSRPYRELKRPLEEQFGLSPEVQSCRIAVFSLMNRRLLQRFNQDAQLSAFVAVNVCNEIIADCCGKRGYAFRYWNTGMDIVIAFWGDAGGVEECLSRINESMRQTYQVQFHIGAGEVSRFPEGLTVSFEQAKQAIRQRNLLPGSGHIHFYQGAANGFKEESPFQHYIEPFKLAALSGQPDRIAEVLEKWYEQVAAMPAIRQEQLEKWQKELESAMLRWRQEIWGGEPGATVNLDLEQFLDEEGYISLDRWKQTIADALQNFSQERILNQKLDCQLVNDIKRYINDHYHQEITLQHIAERFFISRENISRKFKQIANENLSDYLTRLRIDKAKALLANSDMRLTQIAELVGFQDEKYFSRVFKKTTGQTPREYRKTFFLGRRAEDR
ncbi:response regulator transcription factor [Paenibacillus barengoltzii]|uniref:response regulator transcription factor n=1 Tax=Paenibacillus barengoltzii TaxID=343517 RepID=UPI003F8A0919